MMLLLAGCGKSSNTVVTGTYYNPSKDAENTAQTVGTEADANDVLDAMEQGTEQEGTSIGADLFLITNNDMQAECLILTQLNSGKQYMYNYTIATRFLDKYGRRCLDLTRVALSVSGKKISRAGLWKRRSPIWRGNTRM